MDLSSSNDARASASSWFQVILLTLVLILGLMVFAPLFHFLVQVTGVPLPIPLLWGVGFAGLAFAAVVVYERAWLLGGIVGLVVLATFNADVPFMAAANQYPKAVVGRLLLVQLPLAYLCVVAIANGWHRESPSRPVYLLGGFVMATLLAALLGIRPKLVPAGFFVIYAAELTLVVWFVETAIARRLITARQLAVIFLLTIIGHSIVGLAQFAHQDPFGLTYLGEGGSRIRTWLTLPLLGKFSIGPFVAGFTGMSFTLAIFCTAAMPLAAGMALQVRDRWHYALATILVLLAAIVRFSAADSVRGALFLTLLVFGGLLAYLMRRSSISFRPSRGKTVSAVCLVLVLVSIIALPSMASDMSFSVPSGSDSSDGSAAAVTTTNSATESRTSESAQTTTEATTTEATTTSTETTQNAAESDDGGKEISIPLFSTANLGVRLRQYAVALDVFASHPIFGIGGMNFVHAAEEYDLPVPNGYEHPRLIHNTYLALLTETGLLGFTMYIGAIAMIGCYGWRLLHGRSTDAILVAGLLAGGLGIAAFSFWNPQLYNAKVTFVFWILAATISGEYRRCWT